MKSSLKIGRRIILLMLVFLLVYVVSYTSIILSFVMLRNAIPLLESVEMRIFRSSLIMLLGSLILLLFLWFFIIKPIMHIIRWIQALSKGIYKEPEEKWRLQFKKAFFLKGSHFLFQELFSHMQLLSEKLSSDETEKIKLEKYRREWLSGITHDLKTPLAYIQGYASIIATGQYRWSNDEIMDFSSKIEEKSHHIKNLIDDLNISFQTENGKITPKKERTEIVRFLRNMVLDIANSPRGVHYIFSFDTYLEECCLNADISLLQRALQNILMNAVIHNPYGTEINVTVQKTKDMLLIKIIDNGNGMDEETLKYLFTKYYRGTSTDHPTEGSGLGMAIAKQFIELHNGFVQAESTARKGSSILVQLPIYF